MIENKFETRNLIIFHRWRYVHFFERTCNQVTLLIRAGLERQNRSAEMIYLQYCPKITIVPNDENAESLAR